MGTFSFLDNKDNEADKYISIQEEELSEHWKKNKLYRKVNPILKKHKIDLERTIGLQNTFTALDSALKNSKGSNSNLYLSSSISQLQNQINANKLKWFMKDFCSKYSKEIMLTVMKNFT